MKSPSLRGRRLLASMLDLALFTATALMIMLVTGLVETAEAWVMPQPVIRLTLLFVVSYVLLNGYLLISHGQTIGKRLLGLAITHANTGEQLSVWRLLVRAYGVVLMGMVLGMFLGLSALLVFLLLSVISVFGRAQRCLHDFLAGSVVTDTRTVDPGV